jgi:hypothetical protein
MVQAKLDMEVSLAPQHTVTEELDTDISLVPWGMAMMDLLLVLDPKDWNSLQDTVMEVSVTSVLVVVPNLGEVLEPRCK